MNTINFRSRMNALLLMIFTMGTSVLAFAQETAGTGGGTVTTEQKTTTTTEWYTDPMYIIGGAILLIIIIALIARNGRSRA
ncbi:hypothetical protein [uncultured Chryseobacterium sp.]|uniref:hypothetical protein n=1 Tax=uncultured Chryseobacterium sp. TaxID=259322 RepID=UPI0025EEEA17|nr:hypothetical protein [uncultured Chryseobacterium sp.]